MHISPLPKMIHDLHERILGEVKNLRDNEARIVRLLQEMDSLKGYLELKYASLYEYCVKGLRMSEGQACAFISVSRKAKEVPQLQGALMKGDISISTAKRLTRVLKPVNAVDWMQKAERMTTRELEYEIARIAPQDFHYEKRERISEKIYRLTLGMKIETYEMLMAAKDLFEKDTLEGTLEEVLKMVLEKKDPVKKAERVLQKKNSKDEKERQSPPLKRALSFGQQNEPKSLDGATEPHPLKMSFTSAPTQSSAEKNKPMKSLFVSSVEETQHSARNVNTSIRGRFKIRKLRKPLPAGIEHLVHLRDRGCCQHTFENGKKCLSRRYIHLHHIIPVARGGANTIENLTTLCASHHRLLHHQTKMEL